MYAVFEENVVFRKQGACLPNEGERTHSHHVELGFIAFYRKTRFLKVWSVGSYIFPVGPLEEQRRIFVDERYSVTANPRSLLASIVVITLT